MKIRLFQDSWPDLSCDALLVPLFEKEDMSQALPAELNRSLGGLLGNVLDSGEWKTESGEAFVVHHPKGIMADRLVLLGVGSKEDFDAGVLRTGILKAVRHLKVKDLQRLGVYCPGVGELSDEVQATVEGAVMGTFSTGLYKSENSEPVKIGELVLVSDSDVSGLKKRVRNRAEEGLILGESINLARTLTYEPGNRLNPLGFASRASDIAAECGLDLQVFDRKKLENLGMKALLGGRTGKHPATLSCSLETPARA